MNYKSKSSHNFQLTSISHVTLVHARTHLGVHAVRRSLARIHRHHLHLLLIWRQIHVASHLLHHLRWLVVVVRHRSVHLHLLLTLHAHHLAVVRWHLTAHRTVVVRLHHLIAVLRSHRTAVFRVHLLIWSGHRWHSLLRSHSLLRLIGWWDAVHLHLLLRVVRVDRRRLVVELIKWRCDLIAIAVLHLLHCGDRVVKLGWCREGKSKDGTSDDEKFEDETSSDDIRG